MPLSGIRKTTVLTAGFAFASWLTCVFVPRWFPVESATVSVDMMVTAGGEVAVFVNDLTRPPLVQPLTAGARHTYRFTGISDDVTLLRLDPTDVPGAEVQIFSVQVNDTMGTLAVFSPVMLSQWTRSNVTPLSVNDAAVSFRSTNNDPILAFSPSLHIRRQTPSWIQPLVSALEPGQLVRHGVTAIWIAWVLLGLWKFDRWGYLPVSAAAAGAVWWIIPIVSGLDLPLPPVDQAVGHASVFGQSLMARQWALVAATSVPALVGLLAGLLTRQGLSPSPAPTPIESGNAVRPRVETARIIGFSIACLFLLVMRVPNLREVVGAIETREFVPNWDSDNILYWGYLAFRGHLPFRDFWYPYSGFYLFDLSAPTGMFVKAAFESIVPGLFLLALGRLHRWRITAPLLVTSLLVVGEAIGLFPALFRYLLSVTVVLAYIGLERNRQDWQPGHLLFWSACAMALVFEPSQLVHAAPAVGVAWLWDQWDLRREGWRPLASGAAWRFCGPLLVAVVYAVWLRSTGQFHDWLTFYAGLGDGAAYGAWPTDIAVEARHPGSYAFLMLVATAVLVGTGIYERLRSSPDARVIGTVLLGLGLVASMVMQKHVIRPNEMQFFFIAVVGLCLAMSLRLRRTLAEHAVFGCLIGCWAAAYYGGGMDWLARDLRSTSTRLAQTWSVLHNHGATGVANQQTYAAARFARFPDERLVVEHLRALNGNTPPELFALSDNPVLYLLSGQAPVYHATLYNAAPIYEQQRVLTWLDGQSVPYVVFDPLSPSMDGFPKAVRAPLVYSYVTATYVPLDPAGRFEVTRRRRENEPIALAYWREKLGADLFVGHLPRLSSIDRYSPCNGGPGVACQAFGEITLAVAPPAPIEIALPIVAGSLQFRVLLQTVPHVTRYTVSLDRVWFWTAAQAAGFAPRLATEALMPGVTARIVERQARQDILY